MSFPTPVLSLGFFLIAASAHAETSWPEFRGPTAQGYSSAKGLPTEWGADKNIRWRSAIAGKGWSSPIVANGKIFLTTAENLTADPKAGLPFVRMKLEDRVAEVNKMSGPGGFSEVQTNVIALWLEDTVESRDAFLDGFDRFDQFGTIQVGKACLMRGGSHQQVAVVIRVTIEHHHRVAASPDDQVGSVVLGGRLKVSAEEAGGRWGRGVPRRFLEVLCSPGSP